MPKKTIDHAPVSHDLCAKDVVRSVHTACSAHKPGQARARERPAQAIAGFDVHRGGSGSRGPGGGEQ